ncbi:type II secretion system F family protein [uncultured Treponema sp.]|uniref:type II secretion system F family protein n=1 Tax=uncultured Treponema sp. TaxID=162155 RepID=UPI0025F6B6C4|nr:type II secretion system F family protein [uncultured Treponema sp.]
MKADVLLFTQTMHSLLSSSLPLQSALAVCKEVLTGKAEKKFTAKVLKKVNEGKKFSNALSDEKLFPPLYVSLVSIGEESGTLPEVFGHLGAYLNGKRNMRRKIIQALLYPALVLATAIAVVFILTVFVLPRLEGIFEAFTNSSENIETQINKLKTGSFVSIIILFGFMAILTVCLAARRLNAKAALAIDSVILRIPLIKDFAMTMQMHDFSFAMKLLTQTHFPLLKSLAYAKNVLSNIRVQKAVESACKSIACGKGVGKAFEDEKIFPEYLTAWIKIAEENGEAAEAFSQIFNYYQNENESLLTSITQAAEPVFILITGAVIIAVIAQFVIPVFNLLGAL